jgi:hypothetical protein
MELCSTTEERTGGQENMDKTIIRSIEELASSKIPALKMRYRELFGEDSKSSNKQFLFRRIAFRLQANAEGDLSERARRRIGDIADDRDLRVRAPKEFVAQPACDSPLIGRARPPKDYRLPGPGTLLTRRLGDRQIVVKVLNDVSFRQGCVRPLKSGFLFG